MSKDDREDFLIAELKDLGGRASQIELAIALHKATLEAHTAQDNKMYQEFKRMNDILQENTNSLKDHMAQTALLKDTVIKMDARLQPIELERLKKAAISEWRWGAIVLTSKVLGFMLGSGGLVWGIIEILGRVHR